MLTRSLSRCCPLFLVGMALIGCVPDTGRSPAAGASADSEPLTVQGAERFMQRAEAELLDRWKASEQAAWVRSTHITVDTQAIESAAKAQMMETTTRLALEATRFDDVDLPTDLRRKFMQLKTSLPAVAPDDPAKRDELAQITSRMESRYGAGKYCRDDDTCLALDPDLTHIMSKSRDAEALLDAWTGWRTVSPPMRQDYIRFVELSNQGAQAFGFSDLGEMWRSGYDMDPDAFAQEVDRLWEQVSPLYEALHCHVRAELNGHYGSDVVPLDQPIPAHLLGNMWSQSWNNIYDLVGPASADPGYDTGALLAAKGVDPVGMVRYGERFFSSLGFEPLPATFWERSQFTKPRDRDVVCHASAWDLDWVDDLRIKMCIQVNAEDFVTIHHELGHNYYQRAYNRLSPLQMNSANDGFHEGVGDTVALSITPAYLKQVGLLDRMPPTDGDIGLLMKMALDKVAFLPFGLLVDQWRWKVFSGEIPPDRYNTGWWELRTKYQGIRPPLARDENDFDPGAKYHVPANTPYTRYFLAHILQFQFHRSLCATAGYDGPLHHCSIYDNAEAGARLKAMLEMGASRPWPDALEAISGQREMDATAIVDYFAPLMSWLEQQNRGRSCGW